MAELNRLLELLKDLPLEEILEHCDLSPEEALERLYYGGYLTVPPFIEEMEEENGLE
jgi:hypothetical protein